MALPRKIRLVIYTFLSVLISIFTIGFVGITISMNYIRDTYIKLQLDVNKRHAENMARLLERDLESGVQPDSVIKRLQHSIQGTDAEKGFLCMFDRTGAKLICHPNTKMIGMDVPSAFTFNAIQSGEKQEAINIIKSGKSAAGLLNKEKATDITYMTPVKGTNWMLSAHENIKMIQDELQQHRNRFTVGSIILGLLMGVVVTIVARNISSRYEMKIERQNKQLDKNLKELRQLHAEISQQKEEIMAQRDEIQERRDAIAAKNRAITDSIQYASRIQTALLPPEDYINQILPEHFVLYRPKDIVSGDFYWMTTIQQDNREDKIVVAAADCTGHGVPGAFMSMLGIAFLNEIVNKEQSLHAGNILNQLRKHVIKSLRQTGKEGEAKDGMDIALCIIDLEVMELQYAGAYNPLVIVRHNNNNLQVPYNAKILKSADKQYQLINIRGDRMPIGIYIGGDNAFNNYTLNIRKSDSIYMFSDGFVDQFGGKSGRKFMSKQLKKQLLAVQNHTMEEQRDILNQTFDKWRGNEYPQVDDVLMIGIKI